jgi:hypothetical protein
MTAVNLTRQVALERRNAGEDAKQQPARTGRFWAATEAERRRLMKEFRIRLRVSRPARRVVSVDEVMSGVAGSPVALTASKKLRRYGKQ